MAQRQSSLNGGMNSVGRMFSSPFVPKPTSRKGGIVNRWKNAVASKRNRIVFGDERSPLCVRWDDYAVGWRVYIGRFPSKLIVLIGMRPGLTRIDAR